MCAHARTLHSYVENTGSNNGVCVALHVQAPSWQSCVRRIAIWMLRVVATKISCSSTSHFVPITMTACSFLPAVTQMIYDMQLQEKLYGVTFECPATALHEKRKVVRCVLE